MYCACSIIVKLMREVCMSARAAGRKVESCTLSEWGGELEIQALSRCLRESVLVYSADAPELCMSPEEAEGDAGRRPPLRISYHKHYYALGAHYNSVVPLC